jgi:precorrin-6B methylase 2
MSASRDAASKLTQLLDVGSGCGVVAACAAYIVGQQGAVVGIDVRKACIQQSRRNVHGLAAANKE